MRSRDPCGIAWTLGCRLCRTPCRSCRARSTSLVGCTSSELRVARPPAPPRTVSRSKSHQGPTPERRRERQPPRSEDRRLGLPKNRPRSEYRLVYMCAPLVGSSSRRRIRSRAAVRSRRPIVGKRGQTFASCRQRSLARQMLAREMRTIAISPPPSGYRPPVPRGHCGGGRPDPPVVSCDVDGRASLVGAPPCTEYRHGRSATKRRHACEL